MTWEHVEWTFVKLEHDMWIIYSGELVESKCLGCGERVRAWSKATTRYLVDLGIQADEKMCELVGRYF